MQRSYDLNFNYLRWQLISIIIYSTNHYELILLILCAQSNRTKKHKRNDDIINDGVILINQLIS